MICMRIMIKLIVIKFNASDIVFEIGKSRLTGSKLNAYLYVPFLMHLLILMPGPS